MRIASYHNLVSLFAYATPIWASLIAGVLVVVTLSLSMYLLFDHLSAYKNPEEQKFLIGVILMVPCYAVESLVLTAKYYGIAMSPLLCIALEDILLLAWMIIKSLTALLAVVLEAFNVYCEGEFKWGCGYPYMAVVLNFSQSWALYCLIQFYTVTKDELAHIKPLAKFLTFKSIVFLTWWQGVAIALLYSLGLFKSPIAQGLQFKSSVQDFIICIEPYEQMGECFSGDISVLGDYSADCPLDPDEIRDSERPTKLRLPQPDVDIKSGMTIRESVRDVFVGGSGYIVNDVKFTVNQAVEPVEKGITKFNEKIHKISQNIKRHDKDRRKTKDDSCIASSHTRRVIRGIDDPLLNGSISDSAPTRKKHRRKSGYTSGESGGESSSDQNYGGYEIRGRRWVTKD
ncbi:protein LAZ1 [Citrus sinensis]|uniref:Protein LAZ1 n=1 Tax=Citrus sinensis TaxID=2711 RepID=A0ACB8IBR7_CITSI|nr:protein LAZ1 [Citrus sinensis]KAH9694381.1 protein LAZ1 [Citrus sinensis]